MILLILGVICLVIGLMAGFLLSSLFRGKTKTESPDLLETGQPRPGLVEVVRFWTDAEGKRVIPEVQGKFINSQQDLTPEQQARLSRLMEHLRSDAAPVARSSNQPPSTVTPPMPTPVQAPSVSFIGSLGKAMQGDVRLPQPANKSIAAQIDEILQEKLDGTEMEKKGIRLMELPGKGMVVLVGLEQYAGVGDVPDTEVQAVIRAAVQDWEQRVSSSGD